jgi:hypothetical protein
MYAFLLFFLTFVLLLLFNFSFWPLFFFCFSSFLFDLHFH